VFCARKSEGLDVKLNPQRKRERGSRGEGDRVESLNQKEGHFGLRGGERKDQKCKRERIAKVALSQRRGVWASTRIGKTTINASD